MKSQIVINAGQCKWHVEQTRYKCLSCILPWNKAAGGKQGCYCFTMDGVREATGIR